MGSFIQTKAKPTGRQAFVCCDCGLRVSGRRLADGRIVSYDRAPDSDAPAEPMVCADCLTKTNKACAEVGR